MIQEEIDKIAVANEDLRDYSIEFSDDSDPLLKKWYGSVKGLRDEFPNAKILNIKKLRKK